jgi:hypothetical protein
MDPHARDGYDRLTAIIPLAARQHALPPAWRDAHRALLAGYAAHGRPPRRAELAARPGIDDAGALLDRLSGDDLVVLDAAGEVAGAYPFTTEATAHRVTLDGVTVHAMCAVDALAVAAMLGTATRVESTCLVSGRPVRVALQGSTITACTPPTLEVGIHWATPCGHTAHSLCRQMIFLADDACAADWQAEAPDARRRYTPAQAVALGAAFFVPLLA